MIFLQTVVFPEAVPPATPIRNVPAPALPDVAREEANTESLDFVGEEGGVKGGGATLSAMAVDCN